MKFWPGLCWIRGFWGVFWNGFFGILKIPRGIWNGSFGISTISHWIWGLWGFIWNGYILKFSEFSIGNWFMVTWSEVDIVGFWGFFSSYWCLGVWFEFAYCVILFMFWWWCGLGGGGLLKKTGCQWYYLCWNGSFVLISLVSFQLGSFGK